MAFQAQVRHSYKSVSPVLTQTGKTILASAIIDKCKEGNGLTTAFYYCHDDDGASGSAVGILKGITQQLLCQNPQYWPHATLGALLVENLSCGHSPGHSPARRYMYPSFEALYHR